MFGKAKQSTEAVINRENFLQAVKCTSELSKYLVEDQALSLSSSAALSEETFSPLPSAMSTNLQLTLKRQAVTTLASAKVHHCILS